MKNIYKPFLGKIVEAVVDRPLGSSHPKYGFIYEVNYGYVPNTLASDGEGIDTYILGINEPLEKFTGKCVAIVHREDDDDDKLVLVPENYKNISDEEILKLTNFQEKWFKSTIFRENN